MSMSKIIPKEHRNLMSYSKANTQRKKEILSFSPQEFVDSVVGSIEDENDTDFFSKINLLKYRQDCNQIALFFFASEYFKDSFTAIDKRGDCGFLPHHSSINEYINALTVATPEPMPDKYNLTLLENKECR